jgi:membrane fusion protein (multidrug efflux system)
MNRSIAPSNSRSIDKRFVAGETENNGQGATIHRPKRRLLSSIFLIALLVVLIGGFVWYQRSDRFVSTNDAFIDGHVIQVCPKIAAHVAALHFEDNYLVHKGDLLLELDSRDFELKVTSADAGRSAAESRLAQTEAQKRVSDANLGQARAELASAQASAKNALADLHRSQQLMKKHVIDQRELDQSTARSATAEASLEAAEKKLESAEAQIILSAASCESAKAELQQAEAQLNDAQLQLSYTKIYASEEGRITKKGVEPGDYVQPGQTLLLLVPPEVWVTANFKETQLRQMQVGQLVTIQVDADNSRKFRGRVESFQSGTGSRFALLPGENATGNYVKVVQRVPVKIVLDEPAQDLARLWPGESVEPVVDIASKSETPPAEPLPPAMLGNAR